MFKTELEFIENAYLLSVVYGGLFKRWSYKHLDDAIVARSVLEHHYWQNETDTLKEKMT